MFQRRKPPVVPPVTPAPVWLDNALPTIPFAPDWAPPSATPEAPHSEPLPVIFTEADPASRETICALGRKWGYDVIATTGGAQALEALRHATTATIAVVNRNMGESDGLEFCRAIRRSTKPLYIILVTERSGTGQLVEALAAGADDYLITPFDADELRARLRVGARIIGLEATPARICGVSPATEPSATPLFGSEDR